MLLDKDKAGRAKRATEYLVVGSLYKIKIQASATFSREVANVGDMLVYLREGTGSRHPPYQLGLGYSGYVFFNLTRNEIVVVHRYEIAYLERIL